MSSHRSEPDLGPIRARSWELGATGVRALAIFAVVVAVIAAVLAWRSRPDVEPLGDGALGNGALGNGASVAPDFSGRMASSAPTGTVVVAVSGRVRRPGLVRLPAGARVADAIEAAGGILPGTDLSTVNLARKVVDGELILVGISAPPGASGGPGESDPGGMVNLNTATLAQLQALPGVGPVLAERIVAYREQHGGFATVADLRKVSGIGDARYAELKDRVTV